MASIRWSPTIASSWLWGLGFFYSAHVAITQGWAGFLAFAIPNAAGLAAFGWAVDRFGPAGDLERPVLRMAARHAPALLAYQALAIGITAYAFLDCLALPLAGRFGPAAAALVALVAIACGMGLRPEAIARLHAATLATGVAAAIAALALLPHQAVPAGHDAATGPAIGLVVPILAGFLLGPWLDVQQWQRATMVRRAGGSNAIAFGAGGLAFLGLITINAAIATSLPAAAAVPHVDFGGMPDAASAFGNGFAALGATTTPSLLFSLWAAIAMASTLDAGWSATGWLTRSLADGSNNPMMSMIPSTLARTPAWTFLGGIAIAVTTIAGNGSLLVLMAPFATLFLGTSAAVALATVRGRPGPGDAMPAVLGTISAIAFGIGYYAAIPWATTLAPGIALLGLARRTPADTRAEAPQAPEAPTAAATPSPSHDGTGPEQPRGAGSHGTFRDGWFELDHVPTYDDTNSVGNVYFANYIRWVGKAREMFFARALPAFDLRDTAYLILTRDVEHTFVTEIREFEPVTIRMRVDKYDRRFATLGHEIRTADGRLVGRGSQKLMFIDSAKKGLVDIPGAVLTGFMPYMAEAAAKRLAATAKVPA